MAKVAAARGQGVAPMRERRVTEELANGRLVRLFPNRALDTGWRQCAVTTESRSPIAAEVAARLATDAAAH